MIFLYIYAQFDDSQDHRQLEFMVLEGDRKSEFWFSIIITGNATIEKRKSYNPMMSGPRQIEMASIIKKGS